MSGIKRIQIILLFGVLLCFIFVYILIVRPDVLGIQHQNSKKKVIQEKFINTGTKNMHYPNIPNGFNVGILGRVTVLAEAKNMQDIVAWAESTAHARIFSLWTQDPAADWLLVMYIGTSGAQCWTLHLYAQCGLNAEDPMPWKLVYIGNGVMMTHKLTDIECVYIDTNKKSLVIANRKGEITKSIQILQELIFVKN